MSARSQQSILDETQYWRLVFEDLLAMNAGIAAIGDKLSPAMFHIAGAKIAVAFGSDPTESLKDASVTVGSALDAVVSAQEPLFRLIDLSRGRGKALEREFAGENT